MATQVEQIKWVPHTCFLVDGFAFKHPRCRHYFLTHAHSDHTVGLSRCVWGSVWGGEVHVPATKRWTELLIPNMPGQGPDMSFLGRHKHLAPLLLPLDGRGFKCGVIYCSPVTARLLMHDHKIKRQVRGETCTRPTPARLLVMA